MFNCYHCLFCFALGLTLTSTDYGTPEWHSTGQVQLNSCGPLALQVCAQYCGVDADSRLMDEVVPDRTEMYSLGELQRAAHQLGLKTSVASWKSSYPFFCYSPAILPVTLEGRPHFVVAISKSWGKILLADAAYLKEPIWIDEEELRSNLGWDGTSLHVAGDTADFIPIIIWRNLSFICFGIAAVIAASVVRKRFNQKRRSRPINAVLVLLLVLSSVGCTDDARTIYFDPTSITLLQGPTTTDKCVLILRNETEVEARLLSVKASCGCTMIDQGSDDVIPAGGTASLDVEVEFPTFGKKKSTILAELELNGQDATTDVVAELLMVAAPHTVPKIEWCTTTVDLPVSGPGEVQGNVKIRTVESSAQPVWIQGFESSDKDGDLVFEESKAQTFSADDQSGVCERTYSHSVSLNIDSKSDLPKLVELHPQLSFEADQKFPRITIQAKVSPYFKLQPKAVFLTLDSIDVTKDFTVAITSVDDKYSITGVKSNQDWLEVRLGDSNKQEKRREVLCAVRRSIQLDQHTELHGQIEILTSHPWYDSLWLPVVVKVDQNTKKATD
jgi:hypothetical protein